MKSLKVVLVSVIVFSSGAFSLSAYSEENNSIMMHNGWALRTCTNQL